MKRYLILILIPFLFFGCEKEDKKQKEEPVVIVETPPKIDIVENAMEIKSENPLIIHDIDGNERIDTNLAEGIEANTIRQISAYYSIKNNYEKISKELLGKKLSKNYFLKCSSCHDDYANGVIGPSLLTKTSDEIFDMIKAYKTDKKDNVLMRYLVSQMDDEEISSLANEISEFNKEVRSMNK